MRLSAIRASERNSWVRQALDQALRRAARAEGVAELREPNASSELLDCDPRLPEELRAQATEETAALFLHELRPLIGLADAAAAHEVADYSASKTKIQLDRIKAFLEAVSKLRMASAVPAMQEFDLTAVVGQVAEEEIAKGRITLEAEDGTSEETRFRDASPTQAGSKVHVILARSDPVVTVGDPTLVTISLANALRNAVEAVLERLGRRRADIVVNWGTTDIDNWVVVLDEGCGLPAGADRVTEPGVSTKLKTVDHFGMGLPIAKQAIESMRGSLRLTPRSTGGVSCEIRWPRDGVDG